MPLPSEKEKEDPPPFQLKAFLVELVIYAVLVVGYFFAVLLLLDHWLKGLFDSNKTLYALVALALMLMQAVGLEALTSALLRLTRSKTKD